ncbi:choice-of-anchor E domain-containing protein [Oxalobacteraceae bacterium A2-2]
MNMKKISAAMLAATSLFSASAMAASYSTPIIDVPSGTTNLAGVVSFAGFNTSLGTLTAVQVTLDASVSGYYTAASLTPGVKSGTASLDVLLGFSTGLTATPTLVGELYNTTYTVTAPGNAGKYTSITYTGSKSLSTTYTTDLSYFETSEVKGSAAISAVSHVGGAAGVLTAFKTSAIGSGNVTYIYTPTPVPEPETYGMLLGGLGVMGALARRKRNAAKA